MSPRHDLLLARDFPPMDGGIARWMAAIADGYPGGALAVSTGTAPCAPLGMREQRVDRIDVPVDRLRTVAGLLVWSRRAVELARDPAVRFAWCDTIRPAGYAAHWAFRRTRLPYGIMVVGNDVLTLRQKLSRNPLKRSVMRSVLGDAAVFVAISHWTAARFRDRLIELGLDTAAARIRVIPLGTDPARWRVDPDAGTAFRARRGLPDGRWLITVARLVDYKGIDTAIGVLAGLVADYPDVRYLVVGRGPDEQRLRTLAAGAGVADRVHLLTDVSDDELPGAYAMANVYVGLTRETELDVEGFGISFAEAAACGLPVLATRTGGIPDAVVDGETGALVAQDDIAGMTAALRLLLRNPDGARRLGAAGRERVERYLNWDRVVGEMRGIAEECGRGR